MNKSVSVVTGESGKNTREKGQSSSHSKVHTTTSRHEVRHSACLIGERQSRPGYAQAGAASQSPGKLRDISCGPSRPILLDFFDQIFLDPVSSLLDHHSTAPLHPIVVLPNICTFHFIQIDPSSHILCDRPNSACQTCISDTPSYGCLYKQSWGPHFHLLT